MEEKKLLESVKALLLECFLKESMDSLKEYNTFAKVNGLLPIYDMGSAIRAFRTFMRYEGKPSYSERTFFNYYFEVEEDESSIKIRENKYTRGPWGIASGDGADLLELRIMAHIKGLSYGEEKEIEAEVGMWKITCRNGKVESICRLDGSSLDGWQCVVANIKRV